MSETETHIGKLRKVDLQGLTVEQWAEAKCRESGMTELSSYTNTWKEQLLDHNNNYHKYFFYEGDVYEAFEHTEIEERDVDILTKNDDGTYNFVMQFYNGGTCLSEMIEDALKRENNP